jgi:hypothetical protein
MSTMATATPSVATLLTELRRDPEQGLRAYIQKHTQWRIQLLTKLIPVLQRRKLHRVLTSRLFLHAMVLAISPLLLTAVEIKERALDLFVFHPILMCFAFPFMVHGIIMHKDRIVVDLVSDLMRGTPQHKLRVLHASFSVCLLALVVAGVCFILANKIANGRTVFPTSVHAIFSTLTFLSLLAQAALGFKKIFALMAPAPERTFRYHGPLGLITLDMFTMSLLTGVLRYMDWFTLGCVVSLGSIASVYLAVVLLSHAADLRAQDDSGDGGDGGDGDVEAGGPGWGGGGGGIDGGSDAFAEEGEELLGRQDRKDSGAGSGGHPASSATHSRTIL